MDEEKIWGLKTRSVYANIVIMEAKWRKMRKGVLGGCVGVVVAVCLMVTLSGGERVMAGVGVSETKCGGIKGVDGSSGVVFNPSLAEACNNKKSQGGDWGALWISNMTKKKGDVYNKDYLASKVTMENAKMSGNKLIVYMRGAVMGSNGARAECIDIGIGNTAYKPFAFIADEEEGEDIHLDGKCNITNIKTGKVRELDNYWVQRLANSDPFNNNITFEGTTMSLDLKDINKWASVASRSGGRINYNDVNVKIFRCFQGTRSEPDHCYDNNSVLKMDFGLIKAKATVQLKSDNTKNATTGEAIDTSKEAVLVLDNCEEGCEVEFIHTINKTSSMLLGQKIFYNVENEMNRAENKWKDALLSGEGNTRTENAVRLVKSVKLYPGEEYCSTMNFGLTTNNNTPGADDLRFVKVCAEVKGILKTSADLSISPADEDGRMQSYDGGYIAKPGSFNIETSYTSNVQKASLLRFLKVKLGGNYLFSQNGLWKTLRGVLKERDLEWANALQLRISSEDSEGNTREYGWRDDLKNGWGDIQEYVAGSYCEKLEKNLERDDLGKDWICRSMPVGATFEVGREYKVTAKTNVNADATKKTVPSQIQFYRKKETGENESYFRADISYEPVESSLLVKVPYNFKNSTWVDDEGEMKIIDLESGFNVTYHVKVGDRKNTTLDDTYATQVDNAKSGVDWCKAGKDKLGDIKPDDVCEGAVQTETYDVDKNKEGFELETLSPNDDGHMRSINIGLKDKGVEVGDIICVWSWVTPRDSQDDLQMIPEWNSSNTVYSWNNGSSENKENKKVCGQIGKSPTIQVWGGNVLSKGQLDVSPVKGKPFEEGGTSTTRRFGSFGELGVFASNSGNFASGAALGYRGIHQWNEDSKNVLLPSYLGKKQGDSEEIGGGSGTSMGELKNTFGIDGAIREIEDFADALDGKYCGGEPSGCPALEKVNTDICGEGDDCRVEVESCDEDENCEDKTTVVINSGMNVIVKRDGKVVISTNVQYRNSGYSSFSEVPRFIVIAENIEIGCGVKRIDGLLVATGTVNTCKSENQEDREKEDYSNQLIVNGAIIAGKLEANRTYGAGPGIYSIVPAEIVRFDPTLLDLDLGSNDSNPKIVNITELPPRY